MPDLDELMARVRRPAATPPDWYRIETKAGKVNGTKTAEVWIYDEIQPWAVNAKDVASELREIDANEITLHINSRGGDAFQGIAIYNALKDHPAKVTVTVDGLAASAASLIAQAGDRVRMNRGAQMMIHDAAGFVMGSASDMEEFAAVLDKVSDSIAGIYASRIGGTVEEWRAAMRAESWYTAAEAVEVGLADELVTEEPPQRPANAWDLSVFNYAGRDAAPPPVLNHRPPTPETPPAPKVTAAEAARRIHAASVKQTPDANPAAGQPPNREGAAEMQFTDEERTTLRARCQLPEGADDDAIKAALLAPPSTNQGGDPPVTTPASPPKPELVHAAGTMTIDVSAWAEQQERIKRLEAQDARRRADERDQVIANAVAEGKFAPARKEHWVRLWDADPEGTRQVIESLARNVVPVAELGYAGDGDGVSIDDEFRHLFPPEMTQKGA